MGYSQAGQDQFVIDMLKGKNGGVYVEIGAYHSTSISNTYMLEKEYGWTGISFEIVQERVNEFNLNRLNKCYAVDATVFDYGSLFNMLNLPNQIDYLQVDIEPATNSLQALLALPLEKYRFSVITFEHDLYADPNNIDIKNRQKELLSGLGYELVRENVTCNHPDFPFEDWWIDPKVVSYPQPDMLKMS
jgi:hypothetical protein